MYQHVKINSNNISAKHTVSGITGITENIGSVIWEVFVDLGLF